MIDLGIVVLTLFPTNFQWEVNLRVLIQVDGGCDYLYVIYLHSWRTSTMLSSWDHSKRCMNPTIGWYDLGSKVFIQWHIWIPWKRLHHVITYSWIEIDLLQYSCFICNFSCLMDKHGCLSFQPNILRLHLVRIWALVET